jgi:hypothetical protein
MLTTSMKTSTKNTKKHTKKNKKHIPQHNKSPNFLRRTYFAPSHTVTNGAKYKTEAWKRYQVIKSRKKEEQEEATDGACNLQCSRWKEGQSGAPPIPPVADLPP